MKRVLALLLVAVLAPNLAAQEKRKPKISISRDTTYITGPIDADGYPDYITALNERLSAGVTADNNANVLLFKAIGSHPEGANIPDEFFKWMKMPPPPEKGDYLVPFDRFVRSRVKID